MSRGSLAHAGGGVEYRPALREAALYWLQQSAAQDDAEAMHWLGLAAAAHHEGAGPQPLDRQSEALMWVARAAAHGHVIAQRQLDALLEQTRSRPD